MWNVNGSKLWLFKQKIYKKNTLGINRNNECIESSNGTKEWYLNGEFHREDGPAIEYLNGCKEWWVNGRHHRIDGPAIDAPHSFKAWYLNNKRCRLDGPAYEGIHGDNYWFINGIHIGGINQFIHYCRG